MSDNPITKEPIPDDASVATFAAGCFWCIESGFEALDGVYESVSGYAGGEEVDPTYEQVASGQTGHAEAVQVYYDPERVYYEDLLEVFWRYIDPTDAGGQYVDRGSQYRTIIFYHDDGQKKTAEESKRSLEETGEYDKPIVTSVEPYTVFYEAEEYHQDFYLKQSEQYKRYKEGSGRSSDL